MENNDQEEIRRPLDKVKVLDLTHYIAGPCCTKLLADYGAEVIKIEKPGEGDGARRLGPFFNDEPHPDKSGLFLHLNTNKKGITLNLKTETGVKIFRVLADDRRFEYLTDLSHKDEFEDLFLPRIIQQTKREATEKAQKVGVSGAGLHTPQDVVNDRRLKESEFFFELDHPEAGTHPYPGFIWKMSRTPPVAGRLAPCLGEHNDYVYRVLLGKSEEQMRQLTEEGHIGTDYIPGDH
ncbi:MAG: CoA transferase [Thermodesulfobacteriota bacterium]|nr:CoA transferase [Thermodesulfobacteriota bacterium]